MRKEFFNKKLCLIVTLFAAQTTLAQIPLSPDDLLGKISTINKNWQQGGIFNGEYPEKEILASRTEYTKKFDKGNGVVDMIFGGPFHYADNKGGWQDINLNIKHQANGVYAYLNEENKFISRFAKNVNDGVKMEYKNTGIGFGINTSIAATNWIPTASNNSNILTNENSIAYKNIYENIDLEYELTTEAMQHRMIFKNKNVFKGLLQQHFITVEETINLPFNTILKDENGIINTNRITKGNIFIVVNEDTIFTILSAHIWDASFKGNILEKGDEIISGVSDIKTSVYFLQDNAIKLIATIPTEWLLAPERVYPITLDPTVNVGNAGSFNSSYRYPFNTCRQQRISQILFLKSDINAGNINTTGNITQIDFFQNTNNPIANNNVRVKMQEVIWNEMTTPTLTSTGFIDCNVPATQNFTSGGSNNWRFLTLGNPFPFTNTKNLLIEVSFNNSPNNTSGCTCTNTGPGGYWGWYNSPYAGHRWAYSNSAALPPSGGDCEYSNSPERNPAYGYFIPATKITINTAVGCSPVNISSHPSSQTIVAPAQAQFSVSASGTTPSYQWKMSTDGGATWSNAPAVAPYSGSTSNQLTINPTSTVMNGNRFRCEVTNSCTTPSPATSNTAVLTINAAGCATVITPTSSPSIPAAGGTGSFGINVTPNTCSWSASETLTWVTITSPLSGTGDATLNYTVAANTGTARNGIITVNGQNYTVNQLGAAAPTSYIISGRVIENGSPGLPGVTISTSPAVGTAITDAQGYYTITVPLSYNGTVTPTLAPFNFTPLFRSVSSTNYSNKDFDAQAVSIAITSSVIPPWQREGDDYNGSVTVQINNSTTNSWHLEADVYDANNNPIPGGNVQFANTTSTTYSFSTATNLQLKNLSLNGRTVRYAAVFDANTTIQAYPGISTGIIERKMDKENIVYYNDVASTDKIIVPIKWIQNSIPTKVEIIRHGYVAARLDPFTISPESIKRYENGNIFNNGFFEINQFGYCIISKNNSNVSNSKLLPGDFRYRVYYSTNFGELVLDDGVFDLTKIGRISEKTIGNTPSPKVLVMVGGILNEIESSIDALFQNESDVSNNPNSVITYSVIEYCRKKCVNKQFSSWYIAQGNANEVIRNAYDIGIALKRIYEINNASLNGIQTNEINIVCHSKGGLDTRAMIAGSNINYSKSLNNQPFDYNNSVLNGKIKKIIFIATPHRGASSLVGLITFPGGLQLPGVKDLRSNSDITLRLKTQTIPSGIKFLNLTGYGKIQLSFFYGLGDGVVNIADSHKPEPFNIDGNIVQLYQNDLRHFVSPVGLTPLSYVSGMFHMQIHKDVCLNWTNPSAPIYNEYNCTENISNLEKIRQFLNDGPTTILSCKKSIYQYIGVTAGSILSGAKINFHSNGFKEYLGNSDENGAFNLELLDPLSDLDSISISSGGYDSIVIPINNEIINSKKISIAAIKSTLVSNRVQFPSLSLVSQNPVTSNSTVQIRVTAKNASQFLINQHNSESIFVQLFPINNTATIPLDTGYNRIIVKFIGIDTAIQIKDVFYLPDSLMDNYAMDFKVNSLNRFIGSKMFVNNVFYTDINTNTTIVKILKAINTVKFIKHGYRDTIFNIDSDSIINLTMQPYSYSSLTDSIIFNFNNKLNPQYWKTITVKSLSVTTNKQVSAMQYDDSYIGLSLKPQTRKFVFRKLGSAAPASFKTAIALDQINTPDKDSVYLLYKNGSTWVKYLANQTGISEYDPEVQKIAFDKLYIDDNQTREIVLMQKQAPRMKNLDTIWHSGQTIAFPLSIFVGDPDSIKNDLGIFSSDVKVSVVGNIVYITAPVNFIGTTTYSLSGTHDFLDVSKTYIMKVIPPEVYIPNAFTPNRDGLNDVVRPIFLGKLISCHFIIFNRNGQKIYETTDCAGGWDGRIKGAVQDPGTYVWMLSYQFEGEEKKETKGTVTLIR